jgi:tRNA (guanine-N7-)-methyltransferase
MTRPKDLHSPTKTVSSPIIIQDKVWYLPARADISQFQFPGWISESLFNREAPIFIEYCSGNGTWIAEKAQEFPEYNWLAVEKRFDRTRKIWSKIKNLNLQNLVVACAEGLSLSKSFFPPLSIQHIFINFPDPWPKKRHFKHRIISSTLLEEILRTLSPGGLFTFVTDDQPYSELFLEIIEPFSSFFQPVGLMPRHPPEDYGTSFFDSLFRSQGKPIFFHELKKTTI